MSKYKLPLISVIIPVYNTEKYLKDCVNSVLNQTYKNLEIILVDDGSTDSCPQICDEYNKKDKRIIVMHKINGGLSDARNQGIEVAKGEYIAFIDSDDYISTVFIEELHNACELNAVDISCCNFYRKYRNNHTAAHKPTANKKFTNIEAVKDIFLANSLCEVMTWNKLYRISLFKQSNIRFPVGKLHEDVYTTYKLFYLANGIIYINEPLYFYLQRPDSIMGRKFNNKRLDALGALDETKTYIIYHNLNLLAEYQSYILLVTLGLVTDYTQSGVKDKQVERQLQNRLSSVRLRGNSFITYKHKMMCILARIGFKPYGLLRRLYEIKFNYMIGKLGKI